MGVVKKNNNGILHQESGPIQPAPLIGKKHGLKCSKEFSSQLVFFSFTPPGIPTSTLLLVEGKLGQVSLVIHFPGVDRVSA